jgi:hypothetical protein
MAERDAFGREQGEDTLADMGWTTSSPAEPQSVPVMPMPTPLEAAPASVEPPRPEPAVQMAAPRPPRPPRRRRRRGYVRLIVFLAIVVAAAVNAGSVIEWGREQADELESAVRDAVPTTVAPPVGLEGESLFREAALRDALAQLPDGDVELLRVAPERIDAQVVVDGRMVNVQVTSDGRVTTVETPAPGRGEPVNVHPAAPARIVRTAARRAGRDPESVSYLVLMSLGETAEWQLFFDDGLHYSASAGGSRVKRVG